jgi:2,4-dienoyl-CoA reductase-like NADH-dependent reductase (Old Yellow Enzyme family)
LPNRLVKAAMTENLADRQNRPTEAHVRLYERWGRGGTGVLITGNVMVDRRSLEGPRNVAVEDDRDLEMLRRWAEAAQANGSQLWMQISHPGRQTPRGVSSEIVAPSAVPFKGQLAPMFRRPRALREDEIARIVERFARTAEIAKAAGFAGVQIHSAHGYLLSQFLTPLVNRRTDQWGGSLENRMRLLLEIARATRAAVGPEYPIAVKLNSADFQRGGFSEEESMQVVQALAAEGVDLLEISGGNYENPMMVKRGEVKPSGRESTVAREAYFLDYAEKVREVSTIPLMLTGGLRTASVMAALVASGKVDCIGLARPLALDPDFSKKILSGEVAVAPHGKSHVGIRIIDDMLQSMWHQEQIWRMAAGKAPKLNLSRMAALTRGVYNVFGP